MLHQAQMNWILSDEKYHKQVLPDGSVLRINKTLIHDTDEEGNGFFFQSSIHQILKEDEEEIEYTEEEIEDNAEEIEDVEEEIEENENSYPVEDDDDVIWLLCCTERCSYQRCSAAQGLHMEPCAPHTPVFIPILSILSNCMGSLSCLSPC